MPPPGERDAPCGAGAGALRLRWFDYAHHRSGQGGAEAGQVHRSRLGGETGFTGGHRIRHRGKPRPSLYPVHPVYPCDPLPGPIGLRASHLTSVALSLPFQGRFICLGRRGRGCRVGNGHPVGRCGAPDRRTRRRRRRPPASIWRSTLRRTSTVWAAWRSPAHSPWAFGGRYVAGGHDHVLRAQQLKCRRDGHATTPGFTAVGLAAAVGALDFIQADGKVA